MHFSSRLVYMEKQLGMEDLARLGRVMCRRVSVEDVFEGAFLVISLVGRGIVVFDMLQELRQGCRVKADLLQLVGEPVDALFELRVGDGRVDPLGRKALVPEALLEDMAKLHGWAGRADRSDSSTGARGLLRGSARERMAGFLPIWFRGGSAGEERWSQRPRGQVVSGACEDDGSGAKASPRGVGRVW